MKINRVPKILECIASGASCIDDYFVFFEDPSGKHREYRAQWRRMRKPISTTQRRRVSEMLSRLKKQGLIGRVKTPTGFRFHLLEKGATYLEKSKTFHPPNYHGEKGSTAKIVVYDIPEQERAKRRWLRLALLNLKFEMLQKSVWVGKGKLPKEFINDLVELKILQYVDILEVTKTGTIRKF